MIRVLCDRGPNHIQCSSTDEAQSKQTNVPLLWVALCSSSPTVGWGACPVDMAASPLKSWIGLGLKGLGFQNNVLVFWSLGSKKILLLVTLKADLALWQSVTKDLYAFFSPSFPILHATIGHSTACFVDDLMLCICNKFCIKFLSLNWYNEYYSWLPTGMSKSYHFYYHSLPVWEVRGWNCCEN